MDNYNSIKVLSSVEHIRKRPHMYISSGHPSYQMWSEIVDNAIDETMNGYADKVIITVDYEKNYIAVTDNGRGLPQHYNEDFRKSDVVLIYTQLNAGGKFDQSNYSVSGGLHGAGSCVVNALSKKLHVETWRGNDVVNVEFEYGQEVDYIKGKCDKMSSKNGTRVMYYIDTDHPLFTDSLSDYEKEIENKISLLKTLMPHVTFIYNGKELEVKDFREFLTLSKDPLLEESILIQSKNLMVALNWSKDTNKSTQRTYCNSIYTPNGGDHERAVYDAVVNYFNNTDATYGINIAVSAMYPAVEYDSQAKTKAISKDMRAWVTTTVQSELHRYFKQNPEIKNQIIDLLKYKRNEINKRNNKSNVRRDRKSTFLNTLGVSGFADCNTKDRETAELFIVEGNSAAGSAIQARDVNTQAVLPLRGKFINAFTADAASLLKNAEVATIVSSIDVGIFDDVNIRKSRYNKVIIFTDADEDGKNIAVLLISFFLATMPELVEAGMLYLALPPLYGTHEGKKFIPINDENTKNKYLKKGYQITRYKGLGEMNPEQLAIACMNPDTRNIIRVDESPECIEEVRKIMGSDTSYRRKILQDEGILI